MNSAWLGLIIPLWCMLLFIGYFGIMRAIFESGELPKISPELTAMYKNSLIGRSGDNSVQFLLILVAVPIVCLGFSAGYFQSRTTDPGLRWFGHVLGVLNLILIWALFRYLTSSKLV